MVHLAPSNTELANFHRSLRPLVQLPNFHVPGVCVSSPENNFLVSRDCNLATAQISSLSVQIVVTCRNNYNSVTMYYICFHP
ncbi:hypothetical protein PVAP13_5KG086987 [Panicum virgatum]|uniref:Uncharacterized protein n=1 Tax=Panicum virgatum TaxID=38727 RepID=A0A8T0SBK1_PANVG|nr:hypothetical protein PVAP13_5KG086987 [Panicum virgatum]